MHAAGKKNEAKGYDVTGYFLLCMSRLVRANASDGEKAGVPEQYVRKAVRYMEDHFSDSISVNDIAFHMGLDRSYLYRIFKRHMGYPPSRYLLNYRLKRAAEMLENPTLAIAEIATGVGFHDSAHFYKAFTAKYGMTPGNYRNSRPESAG